MPCLQALAVAIQNRMAEAFHVDIHPAAVIGRGVLMDHATGIVIGETAVVGDNVSLLHRVTLGGSGTNRDKRHPTIGESRPPLESIASQGLPYQLVQALFTAMIRASVC